MSHERSGYDPRLSITGQGPALVLVPGMNGTGELFYCQVPRLEREYRVATYTLRENAAHLDELSDDLARIVDTVDPAARRAIVVGESFGGAVALSVALRHPDRVAGLVILNSFAHFAPQIRLHLAIAAVSVVPWGVMPLVRHLTAFRLHSGHTHRAEVKQFIRLTAHATRNGYLNRLKLLLEYDVRDRLQDIRQPALFLAAEQDRLVPAVAQGRLMAGRVPNSELRVLEGHGHICLIAPDMDLAELLRDWRARRQVRT